MRESVDFYGCVHPTFEESRNSFPWKIIGYDNEAKKKVNSATVGLKKKKRKYFERSSFKDVFGDFVARETCPIGWKFNVKLLG